MIHVFCGKKGSGKTKALIGLANEKVLMAKGNLVYIGDDSRPAFDIDRRVRFIDPSDYNLKNYENFYGYVCGILSQDYDIETIFIDGLNNIVQGNIEDAAHLFYNLEKLAHKNQIEIYMSLNAEQELIPEFLQKYVA